MLAASLALGLAFSNAGRVHAVALACAAVAAASVALVDSPLARVAALGLMLALAGWWWGSARLDALPGIGPVTAQKIVDYRTQHGPFHSVDDLDAIPGIGPARIENLQGLVIA